MSIERMNQALDGFLVFLSVLLGTDASPVFISHGFLWFAAFVGFMMFQSAFTRLCPALWVFRALGVKWESELAKASSRPG